VLSFEFDATGTTYHELEVRLEGTPLPARIAPTLTAEAIDPKGEAAGSGGKPIPHFFPPPLLPATIKASNYDNGGEGAAFHSSRPLPEKTLYRGDDFGLAPTSDAGGGYVLAGLRAADWARYTIDCGNGGYFDLTVRAASAHSGARIKIVALDQTIATADVPSTGGGDVFADFLFANVYLNPGELSMLVYVEAPGASLNTFTFKPSERPPSSYTAALAYRSGVASLTGLGDAKQPLGFIQNLGRAGSGLTFGVVGGAGGPRTVRIHYSSTQQVPVALTLAVGDAPAEKLPMAPTAGEWKTVDVPVVLAAGGNRLRIEGHEDGWNSVQVDQVEILPR
jgi:hypothetical protein